MGWKAIKYHYRIEYIVHVENGYLIISEEYLHRLHVIAQSGEIIRGENEVSRRSKELTRFLQEVEADPETFARLFAKEDVFETSLPVFLFQGEEIIERRCELFGYPNVTHDGLILEDRMHAASQREAVALAKESIEREIVKFSEEVESTMRRIKRHEGKIKECQDQIDALKKTYPDAPDGEPLSDDVSKKLYQELVQKYRINHLSG